MSPKTSINLQKERNINEILSSLTPEENMVLLECFLRRFSVERVEIFRDAVLNRRPPAEHVYEKALSL